MSKDNVPIFEFNQKPVKKIEFKSSELLGPYIDSLQNDRTKLTKLETTFYEDAYFNAFLFEGKKIIKKLHRTGPAAANLLHMVIAELTRMKVTRVVFAAYDAPEFECNQLHKKGKTNDE